MKDDGVSAEAAREIRTLFDAGPAAAMGDDELLARYARGGRDAAEAAFSALVARHGPGVLAACRRVLRDRRDAEDAFQATFLVLSRKAGSIRSGPSLAPWLARVAGRVSVAAARAAARRGAREATRGGLASAAARPEAPDELRVAILDEVGRLPPRFRDAVQLCDLDGLTHEEAARQLGCPAGTVKSRQSRGRDRLRDRLARRGLAPPGGVPGLLAAASTSPALPAGLADATTGTALQFARRGAEAGAVSAAVATLARGALKTMFLAHLRTIAGALALCGAATAAGGAAIRLVAEADELPAPQAPPKPPAMPLDRILATAAREVGAADDASGRAYALAAIAEAQARAGDPRGARATARRASEAARSLKPLAQSSALLAVARARSDAGDREGGLGDLRIAQGMASEIGANWGRVGAWKLIAATQADLGDGEAASETIRSMSAVAFAMPRDTGRRGVWSDLITAQVYVGDYVGAFLTVDAVGEGDNYLKGRLLGRLAATAAGDFQPRKTVGPEERAARLLVVRQAARAVEAFEFAEEKPYVELPLALARLGDFDEALRLARLFGKGPTRHPEWIDLTETPYILSTIAGALGRAGHREESRRVFADALDMVSRDPKLASRLGRIAVGQAWAGDVEEALATLKAVDPERRASILVEMAQIRILSKDHAGSVELYRRGLEELARLPDKAPGRDPGPLPVAVQVDADGQPIPPEPGDPDVRLKEDRLRQVAIIRAELGEIGAATEVLGSISLADHRGLVASAIARARARGGDAEGALAWALTLDPQASRVWALSGLAAGAVLGPADGP